MKRVSQTPLSTRAVSEALGVILLLGMITIGTGALAITGGDMINALEYQSEVDQTENSFAKLSSATTSVALSDESSRTTVDLALGIEQSNKKQIGVKDTGTMTVEIKNNTSGTTKTVLQQELGEIRYKNSNGDRTILYGLQNGGSWRITGNGTSMSTPPEAHYESATLTLPLVVVEGEENINSDELVIKKNETTFPTDHVQITDDEMVQLTVQSPYYQAWNEYFKNRLPGKFDSSFDHENNTTTIRLGVENVFPESFDKALLGTGSVSMQGSPTVQGELATAGTCDGCSGNVDGQITEDYNFDGSEMDPIVEAKVNELDNNGTHITIDGGEEYEAGKYYTTEMKPDGKVTFDVSDGNITLAIDGDTSIDEKVEIVGDNESGAGDLIVYTTGDYEVITGNGQVLVESDNKTANQVYGTSDMQFTVNQKATFEGLVYAPGGTTSGSPGGGGKGGGKGGGPGGAACGDVSICIGQNTNVKGAVVGGSMEINQGANVNYTEGFENFEPSVSLQDSFRPDVIYLHISINKVTVEADD